MKFMVILGGFYQKGRSFFTGSGQAGIGGRFYRLLIPAAVLGVIIAILILRPENEEELQVLSGGAEAVMTTQVTVISGIWDELRYSDELYHPMGLAMSKGNLVIADSMSDRVQIIDGNQNRRIGKPGKYGLAYLDSGALRDGYCEEALFTKPADVAVAPDGDIIICDTGNHVIRRMDDTYVTTIAGNGTPGYAEGKEGTVRFDSPRSVAVDREGIIYVADTMNHCIRRIDREGNVTLFAGVPGEPGYQDGALEAAYFREPGGMVVTADGILYIADSGNHCIRKIADGFVTTVSGTPGGVDELTGYPRGGYADGGHGEARFNFPRDIALLEDGSIAVADSMNHAVRLIGTEQVVTLAGGGMDGQFYGAAENLRLTRPEGILADGDMLYISDTLNNRVVGLPLTERSRAGRPSRLKMLTDTGVATASQYAYRGEIRVYLDDRRIDMGRVQPWNTPDFVYVPVRPLLEALGGTVRLEEDTDILSVTIKDQETRLVLDQDYFIRKGIAVTTVEEMMRLFPYPIEWYTEFSVIALHITSEFAGEVPLQE